MAQIAKSHKYLASAAVLMMLPHTAQAAPATSTPIANQGEAVAAQPAVPDSEQADPADIVVTARKREESSLDVPVSLMGWAEEH